MSALQKRLSLLLSVLSVLALVALLVGTYAWWQLRGSLAQLDGTRALPGLSAAVTVTRDALGAPTITGTTRLDVARATGFVHAQDRFFQMDLLRRTGAGELAELVGPAAVPLDREHRLHGFRRLAEKILPTLPPEHRALLYAYAAGINEGLAALPKSPWEYLALRQPPAVWRVEDSLLVSFAMWFNLQATDGRAELDRRTLRQHLGTAGLNFLAPPGNSWDAALDGSVIPPAPLPAMRLKTPEAASPDESAPAEDNYIPGSNALAVAGTHTTTGAALLANDMHLGLGVPTTWYRAVLAWRDDTGTAHRVVGITLPGAPLIIAGSNGRVAWGFTNAYADVSDIVLVEMEPTVQIHYRTPAGMVEIEERAEEIKVRGEPSVKFTARWTAWGPLIGQLEANRHLALRWTAHDPAATNLNLLDLETAPTAAAALALAPRLGMPNQNLLVADTAGTIGWTVTGLIPRRVGYDGREPVSWAFGDRRWDGVLPAADVPVITAPAAGYLWSANQRPVGGPALAALGDGGYDDGARARQIRDGLQALVASGKKAAPADLFALQLDDRAGLHTRWHQLLLSILTDDAVARDAVRAELRTLLRAWDGRASADSAAYRLVRAFRQNVTHRVLQPFLATPLLHDPNFSAAHFHTEDAVWQLVQEKPTRLLNPAYKSWDGLLLHVADAVRADAEKQAGSLARFTWGARNTLAMRHPLSDFLPGPFARFLDLPRTPLPGDHDLPRVQGPAFGASQRLVVSPGHEAEGIFNLPGGQSGHPLSPYYRAGHDAWVKGDPTPLLPGPTQHTLTLTP